MTDRRMKNRNMRNMKNRKMKIKEKEAGDMEKDPGKGNGSMNRNTNDDGNEKRSGSERLDRKRERNRNNSERLTRKRERNRNNSERLDRKRERNKNRSRNKNKNRNKNSGRREIRRLPMGRKMKQVLALYAVLVIVMLPGTVTVCASDPIAVVNNLSNFIFGLIRAIGMILLGFGIVQVGLSLKSHDPSQRANGFLTLAGGIIITFAKEIMTIITG